MVAILENFFSKRFKVSEERLKICRTCDKFNQESSKCSECGCFMDYKTLLQNAECPIGKWSKYVDKDKSN
jgi:hypothetical protein